MTAPLSPQMVLKGYARGVFLMAHTHDDPRVYWVEPKMRGIIPLNKLHISRSLRRALRQDNYDVTVNTCFSAVVSACADRAETWINAPIYQAYQALHAQGAAHSLEVWDTSATLIGGVYGVSLGGAFFGESMFSRRRDASKIALAWLVHRLNAGGYRLFDTQFMTPHLISMGGVEMPQANYLALLRHALSQPASFTPEHYAPKRTDIAP